MEKITMTIERHIYIISGYQPLHDDKFYYTLMYPAALHGWVSLLRELISWAAVTVNDATANGITVLSASVTGIALNGVDTVSVPADDKPYMVCASV